MSNYDYEDDDFDTDTSNDLVKQLRKATKAASAVIVSVLNSYS